MIRNLPVMREQLEIFYQFLEDAPVAINVYAGRRAVLEYANHKAVELWGKAPDQLIGKPLSELLRPDVYERVDKIRQRIWATGEPFSAKEYEVYPEDGGPARYLDFAYNPVKDAGGNVVGLMSVATEITEQVVARKQMEESEKQLMVLADAMPQLVWIAEPSGKVIYYNKRVAEYAGAQRQADGTWVWDGLMHEDDLEATAKAWSQAVSSGGVYEIEHRVKLKDGSDRWHLSRALPHYDDNKKLLRWYGTATNIHEQKIAQERLRESEARFRSLAENAPDLIARQDRGRRFIYVNRLVEAVAKRKSEDFVGKTCEELDWPEDVCKLLNHALNTVFDMHEPFSTEYRVQKTGRYLYARFVPEFAENGEVESVLMLVTDISERKNAEEKLQFLAAITQHMNDAVIGTDNNYVINNWNNAAERVYGWTAEEVVGKEVDEVVRTVFLNKEDVEELDRLLKQKGSWQGEVLQYHKDGSMLTMQASVSLVKNADGAVMGAVAVNRDIREEKEHEAAIRASEEKFRTLAETLPQLVWIMDGNGTQIYASSQWENYTGEKTVPESWSRIVHPDDISAINERWREALSTGMLYQVEARLKGKDGVYRWFFGQGLPTKDERGNVDRWIGAFTDIHEQKTLSTRLEGLVSERTKELHRSNEDLLQFAHVASHDLKEPVRKVSVFASLLAKEISAENEKAKFYLSKIENAANRMYSMIDGVLFYSSLPAINQVEEQVDLNLIMKNILEDLYLSITQKQAVIDVGVLPVVTGTSLLLHQLFYNLIYNSLKFLRPEVPLQISVKAMEQNGREDFATIVVSDNGIGFTEAQSQQIFKAFSRLHPKDMYDGTGLGLALCKKIVERHHGSIEAAGKEGAGATFTITLPIRPPKKENGF